jgi:hypothetical protein
MVEKFRLTGAKKVSTPMDANAHFSIQQCPSTPNQVSQMNRVPYSEAIESVLWLTVVSQPDTTYAVGVLSQFIQNPGPAHWKRIKRVISYHGSIKDYWLTFGENKKTLLEGYCNPDWASQSHQHLIFSFLFHYSVGAIS